MESKRRLSLTKWSVLIGLSITFAIIGCNDKESQDAEGTVMRGVDPFCNTRPKIEFCEDFDVESLPGAFDVQNEGSGRMTIDSSQSSSLPNSLLVDVKNNESAELQHTFDLGGKLRLFGMIYVPELGNGEVKIGSFNLGTYQIGFGVDGDGNLWAYEDDQRYPGDGLIPLGKWASFRWDVNIYDDGTGTALLRFGNDFIINLDALSTPTDRTIPPSVKVGLSEATGSWKVYFDNVTVAVGEVVQ